MELRQMFQAIHHSLPTPVPFLVAIEGVALIGGLASWFTVLARVSLCRSRSSRSPVLARRLGAWRGKSR